MIRGLMVVGLFMLALIGSTPDRAPVGERDYSETVAAMVAFDRAPVAPDSVAFAPDGYGHGAYALNLCRSRTLNVQLVTTLTRNVAGSIDSAIANIDSTKFNRVIFTVGGELGGGKIDLTELHSCTEIVGNVGRNSGNGTAFDRTYPTVFSINQSGSVTPHDIVIRGLIFASDAGGGGVSFHDPISIGACNNCAIFENDIFYATDELFSVHATSGPITKLTLGKNILAHSFKAGILYDHPVGDDSLDLITAHDNFMSNSRQRAPGRFDGETNAQTPRIEVIRDVMHNKRAASRFGSLGGNIQVDLLDVWFSQLPADSLDTYMRVMQCEGGGNPTESPAPCGGTDDWRYADQVFFSGVTARYPTAGTDYDLLEYEHNGAAVDDSIKRSGRFTPTATVDAYDAAFVPSQDTAEVIANAAGVSSIIQCDGTRLTIARASRNALADSAIKHFENATGMSADPDPSPWTAADMYGRLSDMDAASACADSDSDGMPDAFETGNWGADTVTNSADPDDDGYDNLSEYINGTDPLDSAPPGGGTYPSGRDVYLLPWVTYQKISGSDTDSVRLPDRDSFNLNVQRGLYWDVSGHDSAYLITCDDPAASGNLTETEADSVHADWGLPQDPDTISPVGGCP